LTDAYAILAVEVLVIGLVVVSAFKSLRKSKGVRLSLTRGPESRKKFGVAYGFGSVLILQLINSSEAFVGHKVLLSLVNLAALFYLCFLSGWFRNKIIGRINRWEKAPER
jgi:hypothetical protein